MINKYSNFVIVSLQNSTWIKACFQNNLSTVRVAVNSGLTDIGYPITIYSQINPLSSSSFLTSRTRIDFCRSLPSSECRCEFSRQRVFCHNRGLVRIPLNIPPTTKILYLQDNLLTNSDALDSELSRLTQLTRLMLYNNHLTGIPRVSSVYLRQLKIDRNKINKLPENVLGHGWIFFLNWVVYAQKREMLINNST